jgi:opacity protein-like surface antigen
MVDLGFNRIDDKTNYNSTSNAYPFINGGSTTLGTVPSSVFKLNEGKSINVNVWIANTRLKLAGGDRQKLFFTSGIGLQMYNFRFDSRQMYASEPNTRMAFIPADLDIQKNKLGFTYAAIPIGLLAKTRITPKRWLVYGASVTGGYRIASWTKLKTSQNGKEKNHDPFNFSDFNACVMAEVGVDDVFRLYGSYQLTPLSSGPLNQHPFAIGVRFFGL